MIYKNVELHNFEEVRKLPGKYGVLLQRIPESVRAEIRKASQDQYIKPAGGEIRFVSDWEPARVTLISYEGKSKACLYFGDFQVEEYIITDQPTVIEIPIPERIKELKYNDGEFMFSPEVRRIILDGAQVHLIDVEGVNVRPPRKDEVPQKRYLAYGTSITQGLKSTLPVLSFVKQIAWRLGADEINLGSSGSAFCEKELADYISERQDWDFATICVSVNMLNQGVSAEEFRKKAGYMINKIAGENPEKPVVCMSILPCYHDRGIRNPKQNPVSTSEEFRKILKEIVEDAKLSNLYYVDGKQMLKHYGGLTVDLLHPGNLGMIEIAENLAEFIRPLI